MLIIHELKIKYIVTIFIFIVFILCFSDENKDMIYKRYKLTRDGMFYLTAYGLMAWDYGSASFHTTSEGWFTQNTKYGGADKFGHAFTGYIMENIYNQKLLKWGYSKRKAALYASQISFYHSTFIEIGDGFSKEHGFSIQDAGMNFLGIYLAFLRETNSDFKSKFDFRWEWIPTSAFRNGDTYDFFTDYSGSKYIFVLKMDGFLKKLPENNFLRNLELHFGYYTRGYVDLDTNYGDKRRYSYFAIGINLNRLFRKKRNQLYEYYQIPGTYVDKIHKR